MYLGGNRRWVPLYFVFFALRQLWVINYITPEMSREWLLLKPFISTEYSILFCLLSSIYCTLQLSLLSLSWSVKKTSCSEAYKNRKHKKLLTQIYRVTFWLISSKQTFSNAKQWLRKLTNMETCINKISLTHIWILKLNKLHK